MFLMMGEYRALGEVPDCDGKISRNFSAQGAFAFALPSCVVRVDRLRRDKNARRDSSDKARRFARQTAARRRYVRRPNARLPLARWLTAGQR